MWCRATTDLVLGEAHRDLVEDDGEADLGDGEVGLLRLGVQPHVGHRRYRPHDCHKQHGEGQFTGGYESVHWGLRVSSLEVTGQFTGGHESVHWVTDQFTGSRISSLGHKSGHWGSRVTSQFTGGHGSVHLVNEPVILYNYINMPPPVCMCMWTSLPACLPPSLPACLPVSLPPCLPACLPV